MDTFKAHTGSNRLGKDHLRYFIDLCFKTCLVNHMLKTTMYVYSEILRTILSEAALQHTQSKVTQGPVTGKLCNTAYVKKRNQTKGSTEASIQQDHLQPSHSPTPSK